MKHYIKKLFFIMVCSFFSYACAMQQFIQQIKIWPNDQITRRLQEITDISEQMNGILPPQLVNEERLLLRERERRRELEELADIRREQLKAEKRISEATKRIKKETEEKQIRLGRKRLAKAFNNLYVSLVRLSVRIR